MAEIEHFVDPLDKSHTRFSDVEDITLRLFSAENQMGSGNILPITVKNAVSSGLIDNQTLAYFMARTYLFLMRLGFKDSSIRFRQHLPTEMAHYATDCYDAEIKTSYGWIECVGHADRSCYDLTKH